MIRACLKARGNKSLASEKSKQPSPKQRVCCVVVDRPKASHKKWKHAQSMLTFVVNRMKARRAVLDKNSFLRDIW